MNWNDEELSRVLTRAYDDRLDAAEASGKQAKEQANRLPSFEEAYAAAERRREGAVPTDPPGNLRAVPARRAWLRPAIAAVLALAILGGGFVLLRDRLHRKGPEQPGRQEQEAGLSREQILAMANGLTPDGGELIFDDYVGAVQRCQVFREDYGYCCVIRDVYNRDHFFGIFLFDADRRLTQTLEGRAVNMPEGETLDAKLLGHGLEEIQREYGEPLFDAGSGLYIPTWFTTDGRLVTLHGVDDLLDPVARIESRNVLTEGSMPVRTDRFTDEELGQILREALEGDFFSIVEKYHGVEISKRSYFNDKADFTAVFYGKTKILLMSQNMNMESKPSMHFLPLSQSSDVLDSVHVGDRVEKVMKLDPAGIYNDSINETDNSADFPEHPDAMQSTHYTEDGWFIRVYYVYDEKEMTLLVSEVERIRLAYVYTSYAQEFPTVFVAEPVIELLNYPYAPDESVYFTSNYTQFKLENRDGEWRLINPQPGSEEEKGDLIIKDDGLIGENNVKHVFSAPYSDSYLLTILSGKFYALVTCGHASSSIEGESIRGARWTQNSWVIENGDAALEVKIGQGYAESINYNQYRVSIYMAAVSHFETSWTNDRIRVGGPEGEIELQIIDDQGGTMSQKLVLTVGPGSFDLVTDRLDEGVIVLETADGTQELKLDW